jgi:hypothetical protein
MLLSTFLSTLPSMAALAAEARSLLWVVALADHRLLADLHTQAPRRGGPDLAVFDALVSQPMKVDLASG